MQKKSMHILLSLLKANNLKYYKWSIHFEPKLDKKIEEDLIAENQRLRMENEYLKKLSALVRKRMLKEEKKQQ